MEDKKNSGLEALYYSKSKREVPLSNPEIIRSRVSNNPGFLGRYHCDSIKPGTFVGFCDKDETLQNIENKNISESQDKDPFEK